MAVNGSPLSSTINCTLTGSREGRRSMTRVSLGCAIPLGAHLLYVLNLNGLQKLNNHAKAQQ